MKRIALLGLLAALPAFAPAQVQPEPPPPGDVSAARSAAAVTPRYQSPFDDYRAWQDEPAEPWREVNDRVGRVGGHAGALKAEAEEPPAPQPTGDAPPGASEGGHRHAH